jgi:hypothetical protein
MQPIWAHYKKICIWKDSGSSSLWSTHSFDSFFLTQSNAEIGTSHEYYHDNSKSRAFAIIWVNFICNLLDCRLVIFTSSPNLCGTNRPEEHQRLFHTTVQWFLKNRNSALWLEIKCCSLLHFEPTLQIPFYTWNIIFRIWPYHRKMCLTEVKNLVDKQKSVYCPEHHGWKLVSLRTRSYSVNFQRILLNYQNNIS